MCNLEHQEAIPQSTMAIPGGNAAAGIAPTDPIAGMGGAVPGPTGTVSHPTKFSKLLKVAMPMIVGGAIGATSDSHVAGGGEAADRYFTQQTNLSMQRRQMDRQDEELKRQLQNDQYRNMLDSARTQRELNRPDFTSGTTWKTVDPNDGKTHVYRQSPETGASEDLGVAPDDTSYQYLPGENGYVSVARKGPTAGQASPVVQGGGKQGPQMSNPSSFKPSTAGGAQPVMPRQPPPKVVPQGSELMDARGKVVGKGAPKTFAPKAAPRETAATTNDKAVALAEGALARTNGDINKAIAGIQASGFDEAKKGAILKVLRARQPKPSAKRNWLDTSDPKVQAILQPQAAR